MLGRYGSERDRRKNLSMGTVTDNVRQGVASGLGDFVVRCMDCGNTTPTDRPVTQCPDCGGLLDIDLPIPDAVSPGIFVHGESTRLCDSGVWRYQPLLPALPEESIISRGEGRTPIYQDERLADYAGLRQLSLKHEGQNPTGSFKDRGMTVGVSHARAVGAKIVACASTGNTSASLASYAAAAGLTALVLIPEGKISVGKLAQAIAHGARIVQVEGDFDIALNLLRSLTERHPVYLVNSVNPFRLEGQKTIVFEMLEQLAWVAPDVIALPGGNLGNTAAFGKALTELWTSGLIDRMPRLLTVQAAGAAPFADYFDRGFDRYASVQAETISSAIKIGNPASIQRARRAIQQTDGFVTRVTDDEIMEAKSWIDRVGIGCEPASAATLAGVRKMVRDGLIDSETKVVGVLTGHLLKDADAVSDYHLHENGAVNRPNVNRPVTIKPDLESLERTLSDALPG
jgi:threonine synthase